MFCCYAWELSFWILWGILWGSLGPLPWGQGVLMRWHWPLPSFALFTSGLGPWVACSGPSSCTFSMCRFSRGEVLGPLPSCQGGLVRSTDLHLVSDPLTLGRRFQGLMLERPCHYLHLVNNVFSESTFDWLVFFPFGLMAVMCITMIPYESLNLEFQNIMRLVTSNWM